MAATTTSAGHSRGALRRILGLGFGLAVVIGSTLGVGILRTPGLIAGPLGAPSIILLLWLAGGLYTLVGAVCLAELGTMAPRAGGYYVYARRAFGDWIGFAVGWTDWLTYCTVLGYLSIGMSEFLASLVPALAGSTAPLAIAILVGFVALQWAGLRVSSRFQEWTTVLKFVAFLAVVVAALALSSAPPAGPAPAGSSLTLSGLVGALQAVIITYGGWQSALYFTEEDRDPSRNLPRAMIAGVVSVTAVYLLINVALLAVLPVPAIAGSSLPAADAAQVLVGPRGRQVITLLSVLSLLPLLNAILMTGTRILFAMGRDGLFWSRAADVNTGGTPGVATLVTTAVAVALIATTALVWTETFQRLIALASFFLAANYAVSCVALFRLRRTEPAAERPFRAWGYPWTAALVVLVALAFLAANLAGDAKNALAAGGLLLAGLLGRGAYLAVAARSSGRSRA